jgi:2'-5' RNA ligase
MYIWIGCKLPQSFEESIRRRALEANRHIQADTVAFLLPQHISLKISFETPQPAEVLDFLTRLLESEKKFYVNLSPIEQMGNILWNPARENETLNRLHQTLDQQLLQHFHIEQHPFDREFRFHSTLFIDEDTGKISQLYQLLKDTPLPEALAVDTFLLGISPDGSAGSYKVARMIKIS